MVAMKQMPKYRRRKLWFWSITALLLLSAAFVSAFYPIWQNNSQTKTIKVAIGGAVKMPGVYTITDGSDLASLIIEAGGLTTLADVKNCDLTSMVYNDSVYVIPGYMNINTENNAAVTTSKSVPLAEKTEFPTLEPTDTFAFPEIKTVNILYIGIPTVFVLITYYPDQQWVSAMQIPHSTMLMANDYRIVDLFLTLGANQTRNILGQSLGRKIDYFIVQDKFSFVEMIDQSGGIDLPVDKYFAQSQNISSGLQHVNGSEAWDFMRFINWKQMKITYTPAKSGSQPNDSSYVDPNDQILAFNLRQNRQITVIRALREAFSKQTLLEKTAILQKIALTFDSNIDAGFLLTFMKDFWDSKNFSFTNMPGYYASERGRVYYYPDMAGLIKFRNNEIRKLLINRKPKEQILY